MINNINYDLLQKEIFAKVEKLCQKPKLLMHSCCAPCSTACLERVTPYFDCSVFYYNPNITNALEYEKRFLEQEKFINSVYKNSVSLKKGEYSPEVFFNVVQGFEKDKEGGNRCFNCYALRLDETAELAKANDYDYFTTTLTVSPHKNAQVINQIGIELEKKYGVKYLFADFKKCGGYLRSIELSKKYNLYRQNYCGCEFSKNTT